MRKICLALLISLLAPAAASAAEKVRFASHIRVNPYYGLPVWAAIDQGYLKEQGVEVEWVPFEAAAVMIKAVAAGEIDMGTHGMDSAIMAASRGVPEVIVADPKMSVHFFLWVLKESRIREPRELKGTRVGVDRLGDTPHRISLMAFKALGVEEKDVKFAALGSPLAGTAGLKAGSVDAIVFTFFSVAPLRARGEIREVVNLSEHVPRGVGSQIIYGHRDFLPKNPEAVKKTIRAFIKGAEFVMKNREWTIARMMEGKLSHYTQETAVAAYPFLRYGSDPKIDRGKIESALSYLIEHGLLARDKALPLERLYTTEFLP